VLGVWPLPPTDPLDFVQSKTAILSVAAFLAAALTIPREREGRMDFETVGLLLFLALGVASALTVAVNRSLAWSSLWVSAGGVLAFLVSRALPARARGLLLAVTVATLLLAALIAILEAFRLTPRLSTPHRTPGGPLGNRNYLSHLLVLGLPATALLALCGRSWGRWLALASAFVSGYVLVLARSRGAWLGMLLAVVLTTGLVWYSSRRADGRRPWRWARGALLALVAGGTAALVLPNRLNWNSTQPYRDTLTTLVEADSGSGRGRLVQYERSLLMAREYWLLGTGPGNWPVQYPRFAAPDDPSVHPGNFEPTNRYPSSDWIAVLSERGFAACVLLVLVALRVLARAGRTLARAPAADDALAGGTAVVTIMVVVWLGAIDSVLITPAAACVAAVLLGALLPRGLESTWPSPVPASKVAVTVRWCAALTLSVLGLLGAVREVGLLVLRESARTHPSPAVIEERVLQFAAGDYPSRMTLALRWTVAGRCERAEPHLAAAARLLPAAGAPGRFALLCRARQGQDAPLPSPLGPN
jgi:hypothetical protein